MTEIRNRLPSALLCSLTGGWCPGESQSPKVNKVIHTFLWFHFALVPVSVSALLGRTESVWLIAGISFSTVFIFKYLCYLFSRVLSEATPQVLETSSVFPVWVAIHDKFIGSTKVKNLGAAISKRASSPSRPVGTFQTARSQNSVSLDNITYASWNLANEPTGSAATTVDGTLITQTAGLCLIRENPEVEGVTDRQFERKPKISRPGSVDYGINKETPAKIAKRCKMESQSEPEDQDHFRVKLEIEPLLLDSGTNESGISRRTTPVENVPIEASTKVIHRQRPSRKSVRRHGAPRTQRNTQQNTQVVTSASCTIRNETTGSDPERLSVSDAKLQVGEMIPNLSNNRPYNGRRGRLNTLKSVLSESSVVDVTNYENEKIDSPKSAEDVSEEVCNILRAKRKNQEHNESEAGSSTQEGWQSSIQRIEGGSPFLNKADSLSSSTGTNKRPDSPIVPMGSSREMMSSRNQIIGSQMTLDGLDQRSNRSSSLRSRRTFGTATAPGSRSETPIPFQVQGLFNFGLRHSQRSAAEAAPPNLALPEGFTESPLSQMQTSEIMQMLNRAERSHSSYSALERHPLTTGTANHRVLRHRERKVKYDQKKIFVKKFARKKWTYYKFNLCGLPALPVKVFYTKQDLSNLLDISASFSNVLISAVTCGLISLLAGYLLTLQRPAAIFGYSENSFLFNKWIVYLVAATCQYSTIKSPIPDVMSPGHGYAFSVAFARPVYFIFSAIITLLLVNVSFSIKSDSGMTLYGCFFIDIKVLACCIEISRILLYIMPVLFMLGFYARLITLLNWSMESVEIVVFGGTGSSSLKDSILVLLRSVACVIPIAILNFLSFMSSNDGVLEKRVFSISSSLCLTLAYIISRASSGNPRYDLIALKRIFGFRKSDLKISVIDKNVVASAHQRLESSILNGCVIFIVASLLGIANVFEEIESMRKLEIGPLKISIFTIVILALLSISGFFCDYLLPRLRSQNPWIIFKHPVLRTPEYKKFEVNSAAAVMWFDKFQFFMTILIKNLLLPIAFMTELWSASYSSFFDSWSIIGKSVFFAIISFSISRRFFRDCEFQWLVLLCSYLLVFDLQKYNIKEPILVTWFLGNLVASKVIGLYRRLCFIYVHIMPCASTWGSAFHAISQPICMPHSGWMYLQAFISTVTSAPIKPLGGASVFLTSYVRPLRFWEKTFQTKTAGDERLQSQLETHRRRNENSQRNSIFYENLAISLRNQLAGDIALGRFGNVKEGDVYILASKSTATSLNGLLQIVELGNGVVSFQLRGLEFKGTYCQQREVEAITEDEPPTSRNQLCFERNLCCLRSQKWVFGLSTFFKNLLMTWRVVQKNYVMPGYSICDSSTDFLAMYDYRKLVKSSFTRCIIYFAAKYERLAALLDPKNELMKTLNRENYDSDFEVVTSIAFSHNTDVDYDLAQAGVSKVQFMHHFSNWATHCYSMTHPEETECPASFITLVFALSIVGRKTISNASQAGNTADAAIFLNGLYQMFQGNIMPDFSDEWVFTDDMALLNEIVAPALRLAIKLQSDDLRKFTVGEANVELAFSKLWKEIETARKTVICHENDPKWREAVLNNEPELFSFRHIVTEDESSDYRLMMLVRRQLNFKIIKINSESVRGNWAAQQEELVFVRNQNPERGSIQNARAILRNIINSSCDQVRITSGENVDSNF